MLMILDTNVENGQLHGQDSVGESQLGSIILDVMIHRDCNYGLCWQVTELKAERLVEIAPHYYQFKDVGDSKFSYCLLLQQWLPYWCLTAHY
ncbi:hypothetical protein P3L10_013280 [Capsicum annuum]